MHPYMSRIGGIGLVLALAVVLVAAGRHTQEAPVKIGWLNARTVMESTPGYKDARATYQSDFKAFQEQIQQLQSQLDSAINEYEQQSVVLSQTAKDAKEQEIRGLQQRLSQQTQDIQRLASQREQELIAPIEARINSVIEGLRAERNYTLIFDVSGATNQIVAADPGKDLTRLVMQRLQGPE